MISKANIENGIFIFENEEQLKNFWTAIMDNTEGSEIKGNTFIVLKDNWLRRIIKFLLK